MSALRWPREGSWGRPPLVRAAIINRLRLAAGAPVTLRELADAVYGKRRDGGPDYAALCIEVAIHVLRVRDGWPIRTRLGFGYTMDWTHWEVADYRVP